MAEENNLFGNISLFGGDIEIPDVVNTQSVDESTKEDTVVPKSKTDKEDDGMIEIPDSVTKVEEEKPATEIDKTDKKENDTSSDKGNTSSSSKLFRSFANALNEEGIISSFTDEEYAELVTQFEGNEAEALIELNRRTIEAEIESYKTEGEAEYKAFLEARDAGVNLNDWAQVQDNKKRFEKITDEELDTNDKLQKQLITEDLRKRGMTDEDIVDTIESYEDTNKLGNMSKKALKNLKRFEDEREEGLKTAAVENDRKTAAAAKKQIEDLKQEITKTEEIIPGLKLNKQVRDKILQNITTPVKTLEDGRQLNAVMVKRGENPVKYAILEAYFVEQGFFDGKFDKFVAKAKSKATSELEKAITGDTSYKTGKAALSPSGSDELDKEYERGWKNLGKAF